MNVRCGSRTVCRRALRATAFLDRLLGLQFRLRFPPSMDGILFPGCRAVHTFFTFARPDVLFLDVRGRVMALYGDVPPWRVLTGPVGSTATLELPGGTARRTRLRVGSLLRSKG